MCVLSVGAHILIPSRYKENLLQSLAGVNYVLNPAKKSLVTRSLEPKGFEVYEVTGQDTYFTLLGNSFQRLIINKVLDGRFSESLELQRTNSMNPRLSIESSLHTASEYSADSL